MKRLLLLIVCILLLCGCTAPAAETPPATEPPAYIGSSPVPNIRTGIFNQALSTAGNSFEVTETGCYWLYENENLEVFLMYMDHDSDQAVKVCARPDCPHLDNTCNAYFYWGTMNICYYDGYLYLCRQDGGRIMVYRIDPDGSNRVKVMDSADLAPGYTRSGGTFLINGICFFYLSELDENGAEQCSYFYYKLDGSMEQPEPAPALLPYRSDGENILFLGPDDSGDLYIWNQETNDAAYLTTPHTYLGYWGAEAGYYIEDGVIYRSTYADGTTEALFDTGLEGEYRLHGFPDCFVLSELTTEGTEPECQILRFYSWDFEYLGEAEIDYPVYTNHNWLFAGETATRILLAGHKMGLPQYYIEKSDLGTRNIEIHALEYPKECAADFAEIEDRNLDPWEE